MAAEAQGIEVKIAVAVADNGEWIAMGYHNAKHEGDLVKMVENGLLHRPLVETHWVTAKLPATARAGEGTSKSE